MRCAFGAGCEAVSMIMKILRVIVRVLQMRVRRRRVRVGSIGDSVGVGVLQVRVRVLQMGVRSVFGCSERVSFFTKNFTKRTSRVTRS